MNAAEVRGHLQEKTGNFNADGQITSYGYPLV